MDKFYPTYFTKTEDGRNWPGYSDAEAQKINDSFNRISKDEMVSMFKKIISLSLSLNKLCAEAKIDHTARQYLYQTLERENFHIYEIYRLAMNGGFKRFAEVKAYNAHVCMSSDSSYMTNILPDKRQVFIPKVCLHLFTTRSNRGTVTLNADFATRFEVYCAALEDMKKRAAEIIETIDDKVKHAKHEEKERQRKALAAQLDKLNQELGYD